ncbi:MAG: GspH/FimT family protein [Desulfobulbales bacterium]
MQLRSAAVDLYSTVQEAKILAIKENRNMTLTFGSTGYTVGEPFTDANGDGLYTAAEAYTDIDGDGAYTSAKVVLFAVEYPNYGVGLGRGGTANDWNSPPSVIPDPYPAGTITFNSRGTTQNASIFIDNENDDVCYAVTTRVAGSIKLRKFNGTSWIQ